MSGWQVGDRAIFVSVQGDSSKPNLYGERCELTCYLGCCGPIPRAWECDFGGEVLEVNERCLRPIPYDGLEISSWNECVFKPKVMV